MNDELKQQNFILYTDENGNVKVDVFIQDETVWLTQKRWDNYLELKAIRLLII